MAVEVTYADNKFVVTGGIPEAPATMEDVYTYAYNNNLYVDDEMYGTPIVESPVEDQYTVRADIDFGDGSTPSYFASENEMVYMVGYTPRVAANATLRIGNASNDDSKLGSYWSFSGAAAVRHITTSGTSVFLCYGSIIKFDTAIVFFSQGTAILKNSNIFGFGRTLAPSRFFFDTGMTNITLDKVYTQDCWNGFEIRKTPIFIEKIQSEFSDYGIALRASDVTVINLETTNFRIADVRAYLTGNTHKIKNPVNNITSPSIDHVDGVIIEQYTFNLHVRDKDGVNLSGVSVIGEDNIGGAFGVSTNGNGVIAEQTLNYKQWTGTDETLLENSPYTFTLSKAGYETLIIDNITMDGKKDWELELLPALAVSDVTEGTAFGESKTGTFVRNMITGAEVHGQDTVGTVEGTDTAREVVGE